MNIINILANATDYARQIPGTTVPFTCVGAVDLMRYIRNLEDHKQAHEEFSRKTDWVHTDKRFCIPARLGMHRADVIMAIIADHAYDLAHQLEITRRLANESNRLFHERANLQTANEELIAERDALADRCRTLENVQRLNVSIKENLFKRAAAADALMAYIKDDLKFMLDALHSGNTEDTITRARQIQHRMGWDVTNG
ncbi:hypothetical protein HWC07_gp008 [Pantoea phage vB_PagM_LIET2]|uniref:Uncharacterized protein n=1 Tax=Pantoea phage vB_PagM_LIET2 TaxID=2508071 RepID=A0A411AW12_9CAUD|nr:hypothetical protein HWC07_gp008 [Pantoea phage vB_PagM_LIET2]QAX92260.1 hypothetical protein LIET2_gp008 [Pantoea phage vB_PagM_LIET2]